MNSENRQMVLDFLSENESTPLYFKGYESSKDEFDPSKYSVSRMIERVLELSKIYPSYDPDKNFESSKNRHRSCLDIWRHIIYYYPTIEIFDVMHELYNIYPKKLIGQFCNDIERRTFKIRDDTSEYYLVNYMVPNMMRSYTVNSTSTDEFGLEWEDWKDI